MRKTTRVYAVCKHALGHGPTALEAAERIQNFMRHEKPFCEWPYSSRYVECLQRCGMDREQIFAHARSSVERKTPGWKRLAERLEWIEQAETREVEVECVG